MMSLCTEYEGARTPLGYGHQWFRGKTRRAHRVAWEKARGPIPDGMQVLHHCDNPPCVNIDHLYLGTTADNMKDRKARGRTASGERNGHAKLSAEDVRIARYWYSLGNWSQQRIAKHFGVCRSHMGEVLRGAYWR